MTKIRTISRSVETRSEKREIRLDCRRLEGCFIRDKRQETRNKTQFSSVLKRECRKSVVVRGLKGRFVSALGVSLGVIVVFMCFGGLKDRSEGGLRKND